MQGILYYDKGKDFHCLISFRCNLSQERPTWRDNRHLGQSVPRSVAGTSRGQVTVSRL